MLLASLDLDIHFTEKIPRYVTVFFICCGEKLTGIDHNPHRHQVVEIPPTQGSLYSLIFTGISGTILLRALDLPTG